jgi:multicomponent Na+:H+ antiporter subunit E
MFLLNLLLALFWAASNGSFAPSTLAVGFVLGYLVLFIARPALAPSNYHKQLWRAVTFFVFYVRDILMASLRVAYDVLTPTMYMNPGVVGVPLDVKTDAEIAVLANLVSLTPGTLSLDVSADRRVLYIHAMYIDDNDVDRLRTALKRDLERRVLELLGADPPGGPTAGRAPPAVTQPR